MLPSATYDVSSFSSSQALVGGREKEDGGMLSGGLRIDVECLLTVDRCLCAVKVILCA